METVVQAHDIDRSVVNRKVWIVNTSKWTYSESFRGSTISVPPNGEKAVLMPLLAAARFLGQAKPPAEYLPNGQLAPGSPYPKALQIVELSEEELKRIEGKTKADLVQAEKKAEAQAKNTCAICGGTFNGEKGLKVHVTKAHPDYEPVSSEV